jgi:hypothetical protein
MSTNLNGKIVPAADARRMVAYARAQGWLAPGATVIQLSDVAASVIVPRDRLLRDALISHRRLKHHAAVELIEHGALDFLPRRLAWRIVIAAILFQRRGTLGQFRRPDQHIGGTFVEIDANAIAGL